MFITSESVTQGHPDKMADQIADAILDEILKKDRSARVACEVMVGVGYVIIGGEITTSAWVDINNIARRTIKEIGYDKAEYGFDWQTVAIFNAIHEQSPDIAQGVGKTADKAQGAGDQGCIKKGSLVKTDQGFRAIELIKKDDKVVTPYGLRKVIKSTRTGDKLIYQLTFDNGMFLECTPEHKILCLNKGKQTYWKEAIKLNDDDLVCVLKPSQINSTKYVKSEVNRNIFYSKYNHKIYGPEKIILDEDNAYILGELIGDGAAGKRNGLRISFGKNYSHALIVKNILDKKMPNQWKLTNEKDSISIRIDSVLVRKHFENLGLMYEKSPFKITPRSIFISPKSVISAYLRGLFDSDGTIVSNTGRNKKNIRIRLCSSSQQLLRETQLLLNDFGVNSTILLNRPKGIPVGKDHKYKSNYDNYVLSIYGFDSYQNFGKEIGFEEEGKKQRMTDYLKDNKNKTNNSKGNYLLPHPFKDEMISEEKLGIKFPFTLVQIKKIVKGAVCPVYDLEIDNVNMFSANGIYVHNSMFGFACDETPELMPLPIVLAHGLTKRLDEVRRKNIIKGLRPDGKGQVTVQYEQLPISNSQFLISKQIQNSNVLKIENLDLNKNLKLKIKNSSPLSPIRIEAIVIAAQHDPDIKITKLKSQIIKQVIEPVIFDPRYRLHVTGYTSDWQKETKKHWDKVKIFINNTGRFVIGGPVSDTGATGRKIIVDNYGGGIPVGGGSFSGKDATKVDRSGAYMARYVAKNIVASGLAKKCQVRLAYVIGGIKPLEIGVDTFGTSKISDDKLVKIVSKVFDLSPGGIVKELKLLQPIYKQTASYGHFGRLELHLPWENVDKVDEIKAKVKRQKEKPQVERQK